MNFDNTTLVLVGLIFLWTGFVRTGLGFGGAALGLPLMLLIGGSPVYWLPIIGIHLLFFSSLTLFRSLKQVDWSYLRHSLLWIIPPTLIGVAGLLSLPDDVIIVFIYSITIFYAITWIFNTKITSKSLSVARTEYCSKFLSLKDLLRTRGPFLVLGRVNLICLLMKSGVT